MADFNQIMSNPGFIAGLNMIGGAGGTSVGNHLAEAAKLQLLQQEQARHQQQQQYKQMQEQRQLQLREALPEVLNRIDWNNPQQAQSQLAQLGLSPQEMATLFNIHAGGQELGISHEKLGLERQGLGLRSAELGLKQRQAEGDLAGVLSPSDKRKLETDVRKEVIGTPEHKQFTAIKSTYNTIKDLTQKKNPTGYDDNSAIIALVKMGDPTSVVSSNEAVTAANSPGLPQQLLNKVQYWQGKGRLDPQSRKDLYETAKTVYGARSKEYKAFAKSYEDYAIRNQLQPGNILLNRFEGEPEETNVMPNVNREQEIINALRAQGLSDNAIDKIGR